MSNRGIILKPINRGGRSYTQTGSVSKMTRNLMLRIFYVGMVFLASLAMIPLCKAQTESLPETEVKTPVNNNNPFTIKTIEVKGSKTMPNDTILNILQTRIGEEVQLKKIREDVKELYKLGQFSSIEVDSTGTPEGIILTFSMEEWPKVNEVNISGNKEVDNGKIKEVLTIASGRSLSGNLLHKNEERVTSLYQKRGYYLARVETETMLDSEGKAKVNVNIDEGKKVKIEEVELVGNKMISERDIKKLMKTKRGKRFDETLMKGDLKVIIDNYRQNGFVKAKIIKSGKDLNPEQDGLIIRIEIEEGSQFRVGKIEVNINPPADTEALFKEKDVLKEFKLLEGDVFNELTLQEGILNINKMYMDRGRVFARVDEDRNYDFSQEVIDLKLRINEGGLAYIDSVPINWVSATSDEPNKTKEYVIRRELNRFNIKEGELFSYQNIEDARRKILTLGPFIRRAQPQPKLSTEPDADGSQKVTVDFNIEESRQSGMFSIAGGYGSSQTSGGLFGALDIWDNNIFGRAWRLHLRGEIGMNERRTGQVSFTTPWIFNTPTSLNFSLYSRARITRYYYDDEGDDKSADKRYKSLGGSVTVGRPITRQINLSVGLRNDAITYEERTTNEEGEYIWAEVPNSGGTVRSIKLIADRDTRKFLTSMFDPTQGSYNAFSAEYSGILGGLDFHKYTTDSSLFIPTWWKLVLVFHLQTGYISGKNASSLEYERFALGGMSSVRGYADYSIRPPGESGVYGGNKMGVLNIEYRFPITDILRGLIFFDAGQTWGDSERFWSNFKPRKSIGLGLRIDLLGALARLEYGYAFDEPREGSGIKRVGIQFDIGPAF